MIKFKKITVFAIFAFLIFLNTISYGKYVFDYESTVANINIDRNPPKIEVIKIQNTNTGYEAYANKTHTITTQVKFTEAHIKENNFATSWMEFYVENTKVQPDKVQLQEVERKNDYIIYNIILSGIKENGDLKIKIKERAIVDVSNQATEEKIIDTKIMIDNIAPKGTFSENVITDGKVMANITSNEKIRPVDGWNLSQSKLVLQKEFTNNISYIFTITDLAQNSSQVRVNVSKATNINIVYASHNSNIGWSFGYGNYDIAGKQAVKTNPKLKTEALAFRVTGNIDKDFVRARAYAYTHWGEGSKAKCLTSGMIYNYGYNPSSTTWKTMNSSDLVTIEGNKYFQFGGAGINTSYNTDINGNNPIPYENKSTFSYGISGITMDIKDHSYYSILYQIYVAGSGWLRTASDGGMTWAAYNKPMSAIRVALVPKTERQYVIDMWNKDIGTSNME